MVTLNDATSEIGKAVNIEMERLFLQPRSGNEAGVIIYGNSPKEI